MLVLVKFQVAMFLASAFILLGKLAIVLGNCYAYVILSPYMKEAPPEGQEPAETDQTGPILCVALGTYITAEVTLGMFDESVLALMTCRAIDIDLAGSEEKTEYGPPTFYDRFEKLEESIKKKKADDESKANATDDFKKGNTIN